MMNGRLPHRARPHTLHAEAHNSDQRRAHIPPGANVERGALRPPRIEDEQHPVACLNVAIIGRPIPQEIDLVDPLCVVGIPQATAHHHRTTATLTMEVII